MGEPISLETAVKLVREHRPRARTIRLPLEKCLGLKNAEPVIAGLSLPAGDVSAMDGYAVKLEAEMPAGARLKLIGLSRAGSRFSGQVASGEAVRIFTGALMPSGANHVIIQEHASQEADTVHLTKSQTERRHIRLAAGDFQQGDRLLEPGIRLGPAELGLAAAANHAALVVHERPRIALFAAGDELCPPGAAMPDISHLTSSTPTSLLTLLKAWGLDARDLGLGTDNRASIQTLIETGRDADILVPIGGASVGDFDLMKPTFNSLGFHTIFENINVKPGKPAWFGRLGEQTVLGLPGNPAAAFIIASLLLPILIGTRDNISVRQAFLQADLPAIGRRETYLLAKLDYTKGSAYVLPQPQQSSASVVALATANCVIRRVPNAPLIKHGDLVDVIPLGPELS